MKITETKLKFKCDKCSKEIPFEQIGDKVYPYEKGWTFLYKLNFKLENNKVIDTTEKHFCSVKCMIVFITNIIKKNENRN